nr:MAG TPA: hypothetical protein [Microviridae sp.]DAW89950.1 MAG TPA: hypothetical protein [Microviridae sp.]
MDRFILYCIGLFLAFLLVGLLFTIYCVSIS